MTKYPSPNDAMLLSIIAGEIRDALKQDKITYAHAQLRFRQLRQDAYQLTGIRWYSDSFRLSK